MATLVPMAHYTKKCYRCDNSICQCPRAEIWSFWSGGYFPKDHTDEELQRSLEACERAALAWEPDDSIQIQWWTIRYQMCLEEINRRAR